MELRGLNPLFIAAVFLTKADTFIILTKLPESQSAIHRGRHSHQMKSGPWSGPSKMSLNPLFIAAEILTRDRASLHREHH